MSYCRFSGPESNVYCYESNAGFVTHVGGSEQRRWYRFFHWLTDKRFNMDVGEGADKRGWAYRSTRWPKLWIYLPHWATHYPLGLPEDGETYTDKTLTEMLSRLLHLKFVGYAVPDYALRRIVDELLDDEADRMKEDGK